MKSRRIVVVLFLCAALMQASAARERARNFKGTVIAFRNDWMGCLNGHEYWSMLIKLQPRHANQPEWVIVPFSHPCSSNIDPFNVYSQMRRFRLVRSPDCDEKPLRYSPSIKSNEIGAKWASPTWVSPASDGPQEIPIVANWILPAGGAPQELPYGQSVPCYRSLDLPLVPAV